MSDPAQNPITASAPIQDEHVQNITQNLNEAGHAVTASDVAAVGAHTSIPNTEELIKIGASIINSDHMQMGIKDLEYIAEADLKQGDKVRTTDSGGFLKTLLGKLIRKKSESEEIVEK